MITAIPTNLKWLTRERSVPSTGKTIAVGVHKTSKKNNQLVMTFGVEAIDDLRLRVKDRFDVAIDGNTIYIKSAERGCYQLSQCGASSKSGKICIQMSLEMCAQKPYKYHKIGDVIVIEGVEFLQESNEK